MANDVQRFDDAKFSAAVPSEGGLPAVGPTHVGAMLIPVNQAQNDSACKSD